MDQVTAILLIRGAITLAFIAGGMFALYMGFRLYMSGVGLAADGTTADIRGATVEVRAGLKTVGSVVMATSVAWAFVAYLSRPDLHSHDSGSATNLVVAGMATPAPPPAPAPAAAQTVSPPASAAHGGDASSEKTTHETDISVTMGSNDRTDTDDAAMAASAEGSNAPTPAASPHRHHHRVYYAASAASDASSGVD